MFLLSARSSSSMIDVHADALLDREEFTRFHFLNMFFSVFL